MTTTFLDKLNNILTSDDKRYLLYLFVFTIFIAIIETAGVSVIIPFMSMASDMSIIDSSPYYSYVYNLLGFQEKKDFVVCFGILILFFYLIRAIANSAYVFKIMHFQNSRYGLIINRLFKKYLALAYKDFSKQNTSSLTKVIINEAANITELFWFLLLLLSELLVLLFIYSVLLYVNYKITLAISLIIVTIGFVIKKVISNRMKRYGIKQEEAQKQLYEILNRTFNNIKMVKLHPQYDAGNDFDLTTKEYVNTRIIAFSLQQFPRFILEFVGFSLIVLIVIYYLTGGNVKNESILSLISVYILGLYRILPSISKIILSYNTILYQSKSLDIIHQDLNLDTEKLGIESIEFNQTIHLDHVSFFYDYQKVINDLNITIEKNDKIAFIGESGSGKSTLVDIIMGLHQTSSGNIYIDERLLSDKNLISWRNHFGYIPQNVYLFDGTVAQNVAFGAEIEEEKVIESLKKANIWEFLKNKNGLNTQVGESGVMLSGGQKQRIAIARALYKNPDILVLDEATSALDDETEAKIMNEIYELAKDKTLIIIAHRLSTIKRCNKIYTIDNGAIKNV